MKRIILFIAPLVLLTFGCHKSFLEEPTSKSLVIPKTYQDLNALLQYTDMMNIGAFSSVTSDGEFTLSDAFLSTTGILNRNTFLWRADIYETQLFSPAWRLPFQQILNANIVLDELKSINDNSTFEQRNILKGTALFFRAMAYTELVLNFTPPFAPSQSANQLGLPIRRNSNVSEIVQRSGLKETMDFIIEDLKQATLLLPIRPNVISQPGKAAAFALLARNYLAMENYELSIEAAINALKIQGDLLDYNSVPVRSPYTFSDPFITPNPEVLFYQYSNQFATTRNATFQLKTETYHAYQEHDLRKQRFFNANRNFIGTYTGSNHTFSGLATDELWLTAAECAARLNKVEDSLNYLNTLCKNRYRKDSFIPYSSNNATEVLKIILSERKRELITRSGWFDLRRLNRDPQFAVTLSRTFKGETYTLSPNSSRYTFSIPQEEITSSGIEQHTRIEKD